MKKVLTNYNDIRLASSAGKRQKNNRKSLLKK